jgi:hypothetical protein
VFLVRTHLWRWTILPFQANRAERETESEALVYKSSHAMQLGLIRSRPLTPLRSFSYFFQTFICLLEIVRTYFAPKVYVVFLYNNIYTSLFAGHSKVSGSGNSGACLYGCRPRPTSVCKEDHQSLKPFRLVPKTKKTAAGRIANPPTSPPSAKTTPSSRCV